MKISTITIGQKVKHPQYGVGVVKSISEHTIDVQFEDSKRIVDPERSEISPADATVTIQELQVPLHTFLENAIEEVINRLGFEKPEAVIPQLGARWHRGKAVLHPADPSLQTKEVPMEVFFHKIVGIRNQLRVLEQKINAHPNLNDGEKVEMQQYITRCYGSLTTFNLLFKNKEDQFNAKAE